MMLGRECDTSRTAKTRSDVTINICLVKITNYALSAYMDIGPDSEHPNISRPRSATYTTLTTHQAHSGKELIAT